MIDLHIHATDASDLYRQIRDLAGPAILEGYTDEALLAEVRQRMAKKGFVVVIKPFDGGAEAGDNPTAGEPSPPDAPKGKPGRKPNAPKTIEHEATPPTAKEGPKLVEPGTDTAKAMNETTAATERAAPTSDEVKAALNAYAAIHGQMPARDIMQKVGGCPRLMDIPADKYAAVIEALAVKVAA